MLATIALSSEAIADLSNGPASHQRRHHREFTELLLKHGVLVFGSEDEMGAFTRAIQSGDGIPAFSRQVWHTVIAEFARKKRLRVVDPPVASQLASLTSLKDLYEEWKHKARIAVVGEHLSPAMMLDEESGVLEGSALEIATPITVSEGRVMRSLEGLARDGRLKFGESREVFWRTVLAPLAECSRNVVITDRFVFERMWDDADEARCRNEPEHISWLLERLDATLVPRATVKIVGQGRRQDSWGSNKKRWSTGDTADLIRQHWQRSVPGRIEKLEIVLAEPRRERPHDRHIRFGDIGAIDINAGLDRLCEPSVEQKEGMKWSYGYTRGALEEYKEATQWLEAKPSYRSLVIP